MQELLLFTPAYTIVGVYRVLFDPQLRGKIWDKIRHGVQRGAVVGAIWATCTFGIQRTFVRLFLMGTPRITGLAHDSFFGYHVDVATYATLLFLSTQVQTAVRLFLGKNMRLARERAWDQTLASRGKSPDFWGPYVSEWQRPPSVGIDSQPGWEKWVTSGLGRFFIRKVILLPLDLYPGVGLVISAGIKSLSTARFAHKPYFASKKMTPHETAVFIAERRTDYYAFGFAAALLEAVPFIGIFFTISNRVGACMWAFDLEKRQHLFRAGELKPLAPRSVRLARAGVESGVPEDIELPPRVEPSILQTQSDTPLGFPSEKMAGGWTGK